MNSCTKSNSFDGKWSNVPINDLFDVNKPIYQLVIH